MHLLGSRWLGFTTKNGGFLADSYNVSASGIVAKLEDYMVLVLSL